MHRKPNTSEEKQALRGQAIYTPLYLAVYDWIVLRFAFRWIWGCPKDIILRLYNKYAGSRHADIGVGTGFFLTKCRFPVPQPYVLLIDANMNSLQVARTRLRRFHPHIQQENILEPFPYSGERFDSIGLCSVLHCLPGPISLKASRVFENLKPLLSDNGVLFGVTILGEGAMYSPLGRYMLHLANRKGVFDNLADDLEGLSGALQSSFHFYKLWTRGHVAIFLASQCNSLLERKPGKANR